MDLHPPSMLIGALATAPLLGGLGLAWLRLRLLLQDARAGALALEQQTEAQRELRQAQDAALGRALVEAQAARATRRAFLARMSHDLRTPLTALLGLADLALEGPEAPPHLERLRQAARRLQVQIEELLDLATLDEESAEARPEGFALRTVLEEVRALIESRASRAHRRVDIELAPGLPETLLGEPVRLRQLLVELVSLAFDRQVRAPTDEARVRLLLEPGSPQEAACLWASLFASGGVAAGGAAEGLPQDTSLQTATRLATQLGGELVLGELVPGEDGPDEPLFRLRLPLGLPELPDEITLIDPILLHGVGVVLALRDAPGAARLGDELSSWGMEPQLAATPAELARILKQAREEGRPIPVLVLEQELAPGRGLEGVIELTKEEPSIEALILVLPAGARAEQHEQARARVAAATLARPLLPAELLEAMLRVLSTRRESPSGPLRPTRAGPTGKPRVLLADDHEVNLELFRTILESIGVEVLVARDGLEAVERTRRDGPFDLVLMDLRMPIMDGEQAARRIRLDETRSESPRVPIVALTASSMPGDRERLLRAGMDGSLTKPLRRAALVDLVRGITGVSEVIEPSVLPKPPAPDALESAMRPSLWDSPNAEAGTGEGEVIDTTLLQRLTDEDEELVAELASLMAKEIPLHRARLVEAVEAGELEAIVRAAHALRGAAGNVAGVQVRACAGRMEEAARAGQIEAAQRELAPLLLELDRLSEALVPLRARGS